MMLSSKLFKPTPTRLIRLALAMLAISLLLLHAGTISAYETVVGPQTEEAAPASELVIDESNTAAQAIDRAATKYLDMLGVNLEEVSSINLTEEGDWAYGILQVESGQDIYVLAHRQGNGFWQAVVPRQNGVFKQWLEEIPTDLLSNESKAVIEAESSRYTDGSLSAQIVSTPVPSVLPKTEVEQSYPQTDSQFIDEVYGFQFEVDDEWSVIPASAEHLGSLVTVEKTGTGASEADGQFKIEMGSFLYTKPDDVALDAWVTPMPEVADALVNSEQTVMANRLTLRHEFSSHEGTSAMHFISMEDGRVYFISVTPLQALSADSVSKLLDTLEIIPSPPNPESEERDLLYAESGLDGASERESGPAMLAPTGYRLPFVGYHTITQGPGCWDTHQGASFEALDFGQMPEGTPIYTTQAGSVQSATFVSGFGNLLRIAHPDGNVSWYAHLSSFSVASGGVNWEQHVANSGNTGNSTGPHLHFEVRNSSNVSIWIRDMPGITWYSDDPNNPCQPTGQNDGEAVGPDLSGPGECSTHLVSPSDGQTFSSPNNIQLDWNAPSACPGLNGYTLHVTTGPGPEDGIILDTGVGSTDYTWTFPSDGTFYWHVAAWSNGVRQAWSSRRLVIDSSGTAQGQWNADYYDTIDRWWDDNNTANWRCEETIQGPFLERNYGSGAPCGGMNGDTWVGNYEATINFPAGNYAFYLGNDDGAKVWINGQQVIERSSSSGDDAFCPVGGYALSGSNNIRVLLREDGGDARIRLTWDTSITNCLPDPPEQPSLQSPTDGALIEEGNAISLAWSNAANAEQYFAEYWGGPAGVISSGWQSATTWNIGSQWAGYSYSVRVKSRNGAGESGWSDVRTFTVLPATPTNLSASNITCDNATLTWQDNSGNEQGYLIFRDNSYVAQVGADVTSYQDGGLNTDTTYEYYVKAYRGSIESNSSNSLQVSTQVCQTDPDLQPYSPTGVEYPIVPASIVGTTEVNTLYAYANTYVDFHFINVGDGPTSGDFHVEVWLNDVMILRELYSDFASGQVGGSEDSAYPITETGWHTLRIVVDADDVIAEADETNNTWQQDFYWEPVLGWWGEYFNNETLSGMPVLVRDDPAIDFNWFSDPPGPGVNADHFSIRWTQTVDFDAGTYLFQLERDDGARVWIDDVLVYDQWEVGVVTDFFTYTLASGPHHVRMEMYEGAGWSKAGLWWNSTCGDTAEPNQTIESAMPITYSRTHQGAICPVGDVDYFTFEGTAGDSIVIDIDAEENGSMLDAVAQLRDANNVLLAFSDDVGSSQDPKMGYTLPADGTYYILVTAYNNASGGSGHDYELNLLLDETDPTLAVISPIANSWLDPSSDSIQVNANDNGSGVRSVEFWLQESNSPNLIWLGTDSDSSDGWDMQLDTSSLAEQNGMAIEVVVNDWAFNQTSEIVSPLGIDRTSPASVVDDLPAEQNSTTFTVSWQGSDALSGIVANGFDVQYRDGQTGSWIDWLTNTDQTTATFTGENGHTYYLRSRARDVAGNVETYPEGDGDTQTTINVGMTCYTLALDTIPETGGTIGANPSPNCANGTQYEEGTFVELMAAPASGYSFSNWSGDASGTSGTATVTMDGNKSVTATFSLVSGPSLIIPQNVQGRFGQLVTVPISLDSTGLELASTAFSIDIDESCLNFDPTDSDQDGVPDAITFNIPAGFSGSVMYDPLDLDGELDFLVADTFPPLVALIDGDIVTIAMTPTCEPSPGNTVTAPVNFAAEPAASFGNTSGQSVPGTGVDGSVEIVGGFDAGDCNGDEYIDAGDISALVLEIFDGDGSDPSNAANGSFAGTNGCDANGDDLIDAGDMSCQVLLIFNGPGSCTQNQPERNGAVGQSAEATGPILSMPDALPVAANDSVTVPIHLATNGHEISSIAFSIDLDGAHTSFSPADANGDGIPDAINFLVPASFTVSASYDAADVDSELDILITDVSLPLSALSEGELLTLELVTGNVPFGTEIPLEFSINPGASFGNTAGQSILGTMENGSLMVTIQRLFLPMVTRP